MKQSKYYFNMFLLLLLISSCKANSLNAITDKNKEQLFTNNISKTHFAETIVPLSIKGSNFVGPQGAKVRFWGVNLTAFYPTHQVAQKTAENLASLGVNMVRPHHIMRKSRDWNPQMVSGALVDYKNNSREFDKYALDKFDYLNASLRKKGIYLALPLRGSRTYKAGDVDILTTTQDDAKEWVSAWEEIESWHWRKQHDVVKSLSLVDDRFIAIDNEFATKLLTHINPYTKLAYGKDPQVATIEIVNEYGAEYTFICNNKFPQYFHNKLQVKWNKFAQQNGVTANDFYEPLSKKERMLRLDFIISLDEARMRRITKIVRNTGFKGAITYSNLFRGENLLELQSRLADHIEDHVYADPLVVAKNEDLFYSKSKSLLKDKPFIISEFNITENKELKEARKNVRTMLTASVVAYASFHNWSGITWFSWQHGTNKIGQDGWSVSPARNVSLGDMVKDEMQLDHFKTAAIIYRNGYISSSTPKIMKVSRPYKTDNYHKFMAGKYQYKKGWQNIHSIRKTFEADSSALVTEQQNADWMEKPVESPLISDTGQIVKDIQRKQLTAATVKAEIFSGYLDNKAPASLNFLTFNKTSGFATVMLASNDGENLNNSNNLIISKTFFENKMSWFGFVSKSEESDKLPVILNTGKTYSKWTMKVTRPFSEQIEIDLNSDEAGLITLPKIKWYEAELTRIK